MHIIRTERISATEQGIVGRDKLDPGFHRVRSAPEREFLLNLIGVFDVVKNGSALANNGDRNTIRAAHRSRGIGWVYGFAVVPAKARMLIIGLARELSAEHISIFETNQIRPVFLGGCRRGKQDTRFQTPTLPVDVERADVGPKRGFETAVPNLVNFA